MVRLRYVPVEYAICETCATDGATLQALRGRPVDQPRDVSQGQALVHRHYGVGIYRGMESLALGGGEEACYLRLAYADDHVLYVPVHTASVCLAYATALQRLSKPPQGYEGDQCPQCHTPANAGTLRCAFRRLINVSAGQPPPYAQVERLHCPGCDTLYALPSPWENWQQVSEARVWLKDPKALRAAAAQQQRATDTLRERLAAQLASLRCPRCGAAPPRDSTTVWVRQLHRLAELNGAARHLPLEWVEDHAAAEPTEFPETEPEDIEL